MLNQRKRFNYLSNHQKSVAPNAQNTDKSMSSNKVGSIISSNCKPQIQAQQKIYSQRLSVQKNNKQNIFSIQQQFFSIRPQPLATYQQNNEKPSNQKQLQIFSQSKIQKQLRQRFESLQRQNQQLLDSTTQKFQNLQSHLEKVQKILQEKEQTINTLREKCVNAQTLADNLTNQFNNRGQDLNKKELLLASKNRQIQQLKYQLDSMRTLIDKMNNKNANTLIYDQQIQTQSFIQSVVQKLVFSQISVQTDMISTQVDMISPQNEAISQVNYRKKYQELFKKALQMQDEMYGLKQQLFDSQNQIKTVQQQYNTFKILNQIEKVKNKNFNIQDDKLTN